uniref:Uncharacterized protein n=1 Tax=Romanomermis culicivorax TaxID=13658 RepID=A0A915LAB2_ROMCU
MNILFFSLLISNAIKKDTFLSSNHVFGQISLESEVSDSQVRDSQLSDSQVSDSKIEAQIEALTAFSDNLTVIKGLELLLLVQKPTSSANRDGTLNHDLASLAKTVLLKFFSFKSLVRSTPSYFRPGKPKNMHLNVLVEATWAPLIDENMNNDEEEEPLETTSTSQSTVPTSINVGKEPESFLLNLTSTSQSTVPLTMSLEQIEMFDQEEHTFRTNFLTSSPSTTYLKRTPPILARMPIYRRFYLLNPLSTVKECPSECQQEHRLLSRNCSIEKHIMYNGTKVPCNPMPETYQIISRPKLFLNQIQCFQDIMLGLSHVLIMFFIFRVDDEFEKFSSSGSTRLGYQASVKLCQQYRWKKGKSMLCL